MSGGADHGHESGSVTAIKETFKHAKGVVVSMAKAVKESVMEILRGIGLAKKKPAEHHDENATSGGHH